MKQKLAIAGVVAMMLFGPTLALVVGINHETYHSGRFVNDTTAMYCVYQNGWLCSQSPISAK